MPKLKYHPTMFLSAGAAASINRLETKYGVIPIASAGRTVAEQQSLINRWDIGGAANRPPFLYNPARPASTSRHVYAGGRAIDTDRIAFMLQYGRAYGWTHPFDWDHVHFEYDPALDTHKNDSAKAPVKKPVKKPAGYSQGTHDRQSFLVHKRGEKIKIDGLMGSATLAAYKRYQKFLKKYGYKGAINGVWGAAMQKAHAKYYKTV